MEKKNSLILKEQLSALSKKVTIDNILDVQSKCIGALTKNHGELKVKAIIIYLLAEVIEFFNVQNSMNEAQIGKTADLIIDEYKQFKVEDFKLCFDRAMKGNYGKLYNRLDGQVIMEWVGIYSLERANEIIAKREQESNLHKKSLLNPLTFEDVEKQKVFDEGISKLKETLSANKKIIDQAKEKGTVQSEQERQWALEFYQLNEEQFPFSTGIRFVRQVVDGKDKMIDVNEFLKIKFENYKKENEK